MRKPLLLALVGALLLTAGPGLSAGQGARPKVLIAVQMTSNDLTVTDMKYRVMFNKRETKAIPVTNFDFAGNFGDEIESGLVDDKRFQWKLASGGDRETLLPFFGPDNWKKSSFPAPAVQADRLLLVAPTYVALISGVRKFVEVDAAVRMADSKSGRILWKKTFRDRTGLPDTLEDMQAENQKVLKETLNKIMVEKLAPEVKAHLLKTS